MEITEDNAKMMWRQRGLPEESLDNLWAMSKAVRLNDAIAEEHSGEHGEGVIKVMRDLGWHPDAVQYMAEQRAMRAIMAKAEGREALAALTRTNEFKIVRGQAPEVQVFVMSVWIDGFLAAARSS